MLIMAYKFGSKSSKHLAEILPAKRIKHKGSRFIGRPRKTVINWGCSALPPEVMKCRVINNPDAVGVCANKLHFFRALENQEVSIPEFTTDKAVAQGWLDEGVTIVERHKLTGNSGEGIRIVEQGGELENAPLYVKYVPKKGEFRVHVISGEAVLIQKKVKRADVNPEDVNWKVRNHDGGFIFQQNDIEVPEDVTKQALEAVRLVGLDFGAVDVVYNQHQDRAYVLEVNTAPGLMGTTGEKYANHLSRLG